MITSAEEILNILAWVISVPIYFLIVYEIVKFWIVSRYWLRYEKEQAKRLREEYIKENDREPPNIVTFMGCG